MKRILVVVCILAMSAFPAMVSAQGFPALGGLPGIGGLGSIFGGTGTCGETKPALLAPPTFYIGYTGYREGGNFGVGVDNAILNLQGLDHNYDLSGLSLGASGSFMLSDRIAVIASGWWLVPGTTESSERYTAPGFTARRDWSAETNWWWVDALAALKVRGGLAVLGGFRYDRFETKFKNAEDPINVLSLNSDEANVSSNGYIPLVGLLFTTGSSTSMLSAYAVGFPTLLGRAEYHQTLGGAVRVNASGDYNNGYFFEARIDYKRRALAGADMGVFGRYNATRGSFSGTLDAEPSGLSTGFDGGLNRQAFTVGGSISLPFSLPFM